VATTTRRDSKEAKKNVRGEKLRKKTSMAKIKKHKAEGSEA